MKKTVVIAGASGFIGRWFMERFGDAYHIIALTRREVGEEEQASSIEWRSVDLYSLSSTAQALQGADYALYLVHSMSPSTRLNQGSFEDTDLLLADNFARAAESVGLEQVIFVGGILPKDDDHFSTHLKSRYEVELTLGARRTPLTALRAGIIIGPGGSSFQIVEKLTNRLPIMATPKWASSPCQPIDIEDMLEIIQQCLGNEKTYNEAIEVGNPRVITYKKLLVLTAKALGKKRIIFPLPFFTLGLSKLWVGLFSDSSTTLVSPLIESLRHDMRVGDSQPVTFDLQYTDMESSITNALHGRIPSLPGRKGQNKERNTVRSVQRLANPANKDAEWVARSYPDWLTKTFRLLLKARRDQEFVSFDLFGIQLLKLQFIESRSDDDRQLFYIVGGKLAKRTDYGWLEFRSVLDNQAIIAAIHEFVPRLPWMIYKSTQAILHLWVMRRFGAWLGKQ